VDKTNLIALPITPFVVTVGDQQQHRDDQLNSLFSPILLLSSLPLPPLLLPAPLPNLYLARSIPPPAGSSPPPPLSSKKQEAQAAPPLKRLRDAM
jgi:hypothetical protein